MSVQFCLDRLPQDIGIFRTWHISPELEMWRWHKVRSDQKDFGTFNTGIMKQTKTEKTTDETKVTKRVRGQAVEVDMDKLRDLYVNQGKGIPAIAVELGVSVSTVWKRMQTHGIPSRPKTDVDINEIITLYVDQKLRLHQVAAKFGVSKQAIFDRLRRAGVPRRSRYDR